MIETKFNGVLWLARDVHISAQYLGSGKTEKEAIKDMEETITKHNLTSCRGSKYYNLPSDES